MSGTSEGLSHVIEMSAGNTFVCALSSDGTSKCWGSNDDGKLGDNTQISRQTPVSVVDLSNATSVAGGFDYNCALISDGTVKCWGNNANGQLGNGTYADGLTATPVSGLTGVERLGPTGYSDHTCVIVANGRVACWGMNSHGQLGDLTTADSLVPVMIPDLTGVVAVAPSGGSTCIVLESGTVECWGDNGFGSALGNGTSMDTLAPTKVVGVTHATAIATGQFFSCVIADGTVKCWGYNSSGQLGNGTTTNAATAVPVLW
jgi:alpha-tubulin suppressor-like RCC1 family protein